MGAHLGQDAGILRERAYADDTHLDVRRRTHQLYTLDPVDFGQWTLERLVWRGGERVLDIGCGPGDMLRAMARHDGGWGLLVGFDLSAGMAAHARQAVTPGAGLPVHFAVADAQAAPFPDESFDVVMARHMLYHVPDLDRALAEGARLLRPGGQFLAVTNSSRSMLEYREIRTRAAAHFPKMVVQGLSVAGFSLEHGGESLARHFARVDTHVLPGTLRFPEAQPFVDYFASTRDLTMLPDHTEAEWLAVLDFVRAEAETIITRQGHLDVTKITGALVAFKQG